MLEYQFTELDDDYITLWSRNFYTEYSAWFNTELETLAEMGQINAIQKWYQLHFVGDNVKIDEIAKSFEGAKDFNRVFAKGLYLFKTPEIQQEYLGLRRGIGCCLSAIEENKTGAGGGRYTAGALEMSKQIMALEPAKLYEKAYNTALDWGNIVEDGIMLERANEILATMAKYHPLPRLQQKVLDKTLRYNKKIRRILWKEYSELVKENPQHKFTDSPVLSFYLAKAHYCFKDNPVDDIRQTQIHSIFEELATRPYSESFAKKLAEKEELNIAD